MLGAIALALLGAVILAAVSSPNKTVSAPQSAAMPAKTQKHQIAAVGDIACPPGARTTINACRHDSVAKLVAAMNPEAVLLLGDIQYQSGALAEYQGSFAKSWGALADRWRPAPGNHEYNTPGAAGYFSFFGKRAGSAAGYYSYEIGNWHVIALNSNCTIVGCGFRSAQNKWLRRDLARHRNRCVAAYLHYPLFSSGAHGANPEVKPLWKELRKAKADIILSGHDHNYERFARQDENGKADRTGVREFVVGTGGKSERSVGATAPNSQYARAKLFGALSLTLGKARYSWRFVDANAGVLDSGADRCS